MATLLFEIWEDHEVGSVFEMSLVSRQHDEMRKSLNPNAVLLHTFRASSDFEAPRIYHEFMGWGLGNRNQAGSKVTSLTTRPVSRRHICLGGTARAEEKSHDLNSSTWSRARVRLGALAIIPKAIDRLPVSRGGGHRIRKLAYGKGQRWSPITCPRVQCGVTIGARLGNYLPWTTVALATKRSGAAGC